MSQAPNEPIVLKIMSGVQAGVDVHLAPGDYTLGSGEDDDIQLFDVSLKAGHLTLRVARGKVQVRGQAGSLRTANGSTFEAGGEFQDLEPLDVVFAGTSRFATGLAGANWSSITEEEPSATRPAPRGRRRDERSLLTQGWRRSAVRIGLPALAVVLLAGTALWFAASDGVSRSADAQTHQDDLSTVQKAIAGFDFANGLTVREEVDGEIFVTGYLEAPVERRAVMSAVRETGVPARVRLAVREVLRQEVAQLIETEKPDLGFDLADDGILTLTGTVLDPEEASRFADLVRDRVVGLAGVDSQIDTGPTLLSQVRSLADRSQIGPLVVVRLDGPLIEASGAMPTDKIDAWAGFLQAYSTQYSDRIPLRSLVRLQNPDGTFEGPEEGGPALLVGDLPGEDGDVALDTERLTSGTYDLADVFAGGLPDTPVGTVGSADAPATAETQAPDTVQFDLARLLGDQTGSDDAVRREAGAPGLAADGSTIATADRLAGSQPVPDAPSPGGAIAARGTDTVPGDMASTGGAPIPAPGSAATPFVAGAPAEALSATLVSPAAIQSARRIAEATRSELLSPAVAPAATWTPQARLRTDASSAADVHNAAAAENTRKVRRLLESWGRGALPQSSEGARMGDALERLGTMRGIERAEQPDALMAYYAPLRPRGQTAADQACWAGSRLSRDGLPSVLFWLDLISADETLTLRSLEPEMRPLVLEAALNPEKVGQCSAAPGEPRRSAYLQEIARNPSFINFIVRDLEDYPLDIAGVSLSSDRYVQTRAGRKLREGAAPDQNSRIALVGELGVSIESGEELSAVIFGDEVNWFIR